MFVCPQCAKSFEVSPEQKAPYVCPSCEARQRPQAATAWIDVARVTNLAEAGFLSDELSGLDIEARVYQSDEFSELAGGRWSTTYLIRVPSEAAQEAAARIRCCVADMAADEDADRDAVRFTSEAGPIDPAYWRPVAIVVLAGVASFVLGRQTAMPEAHRRPQRDSLAAAVDGIGRPLVSESSPGQPRYRLTHDRPRQVWYLDLDRDGDGTYDSRRQFESSGASW
jgi:hypothetical protein